MMVLKMPSFLPVRASEVAEGLISGTRSVSGMAAAARCSGVATINTQHVIRPCEAGGKSDYHWLGRGARRYQSYETG